MRMQWFTADTHFCHKNILHHTNRPFQYVKDHDEYLIELYRNLFDKKDIIYFIGDFHFGNQKMASNILSKIPGEKHLILGNHDKNLKNMSGWASISQIKNITVDIHKSSSNKVTKLGVVMCHFPIYSWEHKNFDWFHLYGHVHNRLVMPGTLSLDVGADTNDMRPYNMQDIINKIREREPEHPFFKGEEDIKYLPNNN